MRRVMAFCAVISLCTAIGPQAASAAPPGLIVPPPLNIKLSDGSHVSASADGLVTLTERSGKVRQLRLPVQDTIRTALVPNAPSPEQVQHAIWQQRMGSYKPGQVVVVFRSGYGAGQVIAALASRRAVTAGMTGDTQLATALTALKARSLTPMFGRFSSTRLSFASSAARTRLGTSAIDLNNAFVLGIGAHDPHEAAQMLRRSRVVAYASPNFYVSSMLAQQVPLPQGEAERARAKARSGAFMRTRMTNTPGTNIAVPTNYAYTSSLASFLNANAVDWTPAYALLEQKAGKLPGDGEIITNVSIGDLTDGAGNGANGATTTVQGGQRYIDAPSLPLIPTFVSDPSGNLNPDATVTNSGDPDDGEILLDFSVMAPLPDIKQRPGRQGQGLTDLLGIAPGAQYRLVLPQEPTYSNIGAALLAAAQQQPAPNVITASIGFGTDGTGFPGRYLEDDPVLQSIVASIVQQGIVVCIAANDGTRLYTNVAVGPDGGSTATNVAPAGTTPTTFDDIQWSTTPSLDADSGAIDVGGTTLDDTIVSDPNNGGPLATQTAFVETRLSGAANFSSGFGSRVNVSAPSDGIIALYPCYFCASGDFTTNLDGGTSASAPEVAAAAAVVLQAARLSNKRLDPAGVRALLASTGHAVPTPPQVDQTLNVGPQIDVGAAVASLLGTSAATPQIPRVGIAERETFGIGTFFEETDPTYLDMDGPYYLGMPLYTNSFNPITIAPDWVGMPSTAKFSLYVTGHPSQVLAATPWTRLLPSQILSAAGLALASSTQRTVSLTYRASSGSHLLRQATFEMTFSATQGMTSSPPAPFVPPVVQAGNSVTVTYDLSHTRNVNSPEIAVSNIGHWSYDTAPFYRTQYSQRLLTLKGTVTIPASAFVGGGGLYGITLIYNSVSRLAGNIAPIRVKGTSDDRPAAPMLLVGNGDTPGHFLEIPRSAPQFTVQYDVSSLSAATGAMLEISAPGPTLFNVLNNFTNAFGTQRDNDGIDSPSTVYTPLSGTKGSMQLDAGRLGLNSSLYYAVRVLPVNGSSVVGQASPVSMLHFADTAAPGGQYVTSFDVSATGSTVSTIDPSTFDTSLYGYTPANETYGNTLFSDASGSGIVTAIGSDPSLQQTIVSDSVNYVPTLYAIDQTSGATVGTPVIPANSTVTEARVDGSRHRLAFLSKDNTGTVSVVPYDMSAKTTGSALVLGNRTWSPAGVPEYFELDPSTGMFYTSSFQLRGGRCIQNSIASIDLSMGSASRPSLMGFCDRNLISDGAGKQVFVLEGMPFSEFQSNTPRTTTVATVNAQTLAYTNTQSIAGLGGFVAATDPVNGLLLVGYLGSANGLYDNTGMGYIGVYNTTTGALIEQIRGFNFGYVAAGYGAIDRAIQLDPTTRTGWTYSADGTAVQQFSY